jgi:hypothetical protein
MHVSTPRRLPPWWDNWSWHVLQSEVFTTSRVVTTPDPFGTKLKVVLA